ncbi:anthranilate synthase component 1 [Gracilibacillus halotolerans]|uniref:Anthranilate synthase component 1 n=1 Tax=Gracilibacillus halotolerans TaxID=74386 RepID=A0A841RM87_9BACI|nr:anthranilate synthase component I [Gracilibacillus halotolerans]MBB6512997.1 anthranilate synthase component 1 [Gracilibacillus halotolerans]
MTDYKSITLNGDTMTPISIFNKVKGVKKFLLESSINHDQKGRFSFIGMNPYKEIIGDGDQTTVIHHTEGAETSVREKPLEVLKQHIPNEELDLPFAFYSGAIGYIGYDAIRQYEEIGELLDDEIDMPDVHMMIYQNVLVFDHKKQTLTIITANLDGSRNNQQLEEDLQTLKDQVLGTEEALNENTLAVQFKPAIECKTFLEMVETAKQHIKDGDIFQVVLSQRMKANFDADPFTFYRKLRVANPSPYMYFIDFDGYIVLGASPESLIKTTGSHVVTNPIAGTRPRGKTTEEDLRLEEELLADEKELAEHKMLVDLSRNDLGKVCEIGSITIPKYMVIERYQHVMHIVSEVQGVLNKNQSALDALISALPAGTVSGAPKIRAMQIINELEDKKRGVYSGAVGYINMNGDLDLALAIRTMVIKNQTAYMQAGAGIVYDSNPESEYEETLNKAKSILEVSQHDTINR